MEALLNIAKQFPLKLFVSVAAIALLAGQFQPFSRFPMYSSFPPSADLYYLADIGGNALPALKTLGIFGPELKQRVEHLFESYELPEQRETLIPIAANEVLSHLAEEREAMLASQSISALSLRRVILTREDGQLVKNDQEVAAWP